MTHLPLAIAAVAGVPVVGEIVARRARLAPETTRKTVHACAGVVAAVLPLLVSYSRIVAIGLAAALAMALVHRLGTLRALAGVGRASLGEVWFPLGVAALAALVPHARPYVFGALVLGLADSAAALVGTRFGGRRLPLSADKSLVGSTAFCAVALAVGVAVSGALSVRIVATAAVLTGVEAVCSRGTDNVALPLAAALMAQLWA
jgi:phytol kinase